MKSNLNRTAISATLHCLTGCGIGEVLGMVVSTALGWAAAPSVALAVVLAFFFGYALAMRPLLGHGLTFKNALALALAADTASIATMEIVDNGVILLVPKAIHAGLATWLFWWSLGLGLAIAFVVAFPLNRWLISRGKGHAVVHSMHDPGNHHKHHHEHRNHHGHR
jgi:hypothetical protein